MEQISVGQEREERSHSLPPHTACGPAQEDDCFGCGDPDDLLQSGRTRSDALLAGLVHRSFWGKRDAPYGIGDCESERSLPHGLADPGLEQPTGGPDERVAQVVFGRAWSLTEEQDVAGKHPSHMH